MSWGTELWDQYDNLSVHSQRGIDFLEKYSQFLKERSNIESDYAHRLRKIVKNYCPKKKDDDDSQFSANMSFMKILNETNDIAGQHEVISETYAYRIHKEIADLVKELKEERKRHLQDGQRHQSTLLSSKNLLDKNKRSYEKTFKEAEKANENFKKIDADITLSRADVEKAKSLWQLKNRICEEYKTDYANQLQKTNELQRAHYMDLIPNIFQQLQDMEERRIACLQNFMKQSADVHKQVLPIIQKCLEGIVCAAETIDPKRDSQLVIEKFKSGYAPPEDIPFDDLSNPRSDYSLGTMSHHRSDSSTVRGTLSMGRSRKRGGILNFFSTKSDDCNDLPPNQRRKKFQQKVTHIKGQIQKETDARDALMKMKCVYEENSTLGDPLSIENELVENSINLENLQNELVKFKGFLAESEGEIAISHQVADHRSSISEDSLSRSASDSSVSNPNSYSNSKLSAPNTPQQIHNSSNSPESGIGTSHPSISGENDEYADADFENEYSEFDPILGTGKALYPFIGQSEGSVDINENEEFDVVELDQGDGWTRIRKRNMDEGFVPTTYIETYLYNTC